jgi:hypothetical protein
VDLYTAAGLPRPDPSPKPKVIQIAVTGECDDHYSRITILRDDGRVFTRNIGENEATSWTEIKLP